MMLGSVEEFYVDDCLILSSDSQAEALHQHLNQIWETSPLERCEEVGDVVQFLGMSVYSIWVRHWAAAIPGGSDEEV